MADERMDKIIGESFHKSANVILGARLTKSSAGERPPPIKQTGNRKWFNLDIQELEGVDSEVAPWRRGNMQTPLILQVVLTRREVADCHEPEGGDPASNAGPELLREVLLEEWILEHRPLQASGGGGAEGTPGPLQSQQDSSSSVSSVGSSPGGASGAPLTRRQAAWQDPHAIYKRLVIFHRSLYSYVRVLPAFRLLKALKRHPHVPYDITSRIVPAWTLAAGRTVGSFRFAPVDTFRGAFQASVTFRTGACPIPEFEELQRVVAESPSSQARIISDYVRDPRPPPISTSAPGRTSSFYPERDAARRMAPCDPSSASPPPGASPDLEMVVRPGSSLPPARQPWGSSPVEIATPASLTAGPLAGTAEPAPAGLQPSLLPKATPWGSLAHPAQASPSPRSTLHQPPSVPSSADPSSLVRAEGHAVQTGANEAGSVPPQMMRGTQQKAGFHPAAAIEGGLYAAGSSMLTQGIKLAQGGITAAAEAGRMERQQDASAPRVAAALVPASPWEAAAAQDPGSAELEPQQPGEIGQPVRSLPVCIPIPGKGMARHSSSSQLKARRADLAPGRGGGPAGDGRGGSPEGELNARRLMSAPTANRCGVEFDPQVRKGLSRGLDPAAPAPRPGPLSRAPAVPQGAPEGAPLWDQQAPAQPLPQGSADSPSPAPHFKSGAGCDTAAIIGFGASPALSSATLSSAASPAGMSCSPQLPFAFTPSSLSCSLLQKTGAALMEAHTLGRHQAACLSPVGRGALLGGSVTPLGTGTGTRSPSATSSSGAGPGGVLLGRDVSDLAIIRRPSWSQRSFSQEAAVSPWVGCMSPSTVLDASQDCAFAGGPSMQSFPALAGYLSPSPSNPGPHAFLLSNEGPTKPQLLSYDALAGCDEMHDDEDSLPFALEDCADDYGTPAGHADGPGSGLSKSPCTSSFAAQSGSSDAAVGALARMLQEAPALALGTGPTLNAVMSDIESLRHQLIKWQT